MKNLRDIISFLKPENELEHQLICTDEFMIGLNWGEPRFGHPEGKVIYHIEEVYHNIELLEIDPDLRSKLRLIALVHDTFKYQESKKTIPRDWYTHHGSIAARFLKNYTLEKDILKTIKYHDEAYYCWRLEYLENNHDGSILRFNKLINEIEEFLQLYYYFFKCDTNTGDKLMAPVRWFEKQNIDIFTFDFIK